MHYLKLIKLKEKAYFNLEDLQGLLDIKLESARVLSSRYVKSGIFLRLKRNLYILAQKWQELGYAELLGLANIIQVPSYVSFMTALSFYEITTQLQRDFFENASLKRSLKINTEGRAFNYYKLKKQFYFDFVKKDNIFIATKEKAFLDSIYLYSLGKYSLDFDSLDLNKLDKNRLKKIVKVFPSKTQSIIKKLCKI